MNKSTVRVSMTLCALVVIAFSLSLRQVSAQEKRAATKEYSYATKGLVEFQHSVGPGMVEHWKLLLDQSNVGGNEVEMAELTLPAGWRWALTGTALWRFSMSYQERWVTKSTAGKCKC